jgi:large subunit ribosomal protein L19
MECNVMTGNAMNQILKTIPNQTRAEALPPFRVGDTIKVHQKIREGEKERVQVFAGIVIARRGHGAGETFTVRKVSFGEGVERIYPANSPNIVAIEVTREGDARRAKLHYLRQRVGRSAKVREKRRATVKK